MIMITRQWQGRRNIRSNHRAIYRTKKFIRIADRMTRRASDFK